MQSGNHQKSNWVFDWEQQLLSHGPGMTDAEMEACAPLLTILLCGEQSAIKIFASEIERSRQSRFPTSEAVNHGLKQLIEIEQDEQLHEHALQKLAAYFPQATDLHQHRRRAQRFFARLGKNQKMSHHFGQISCLDAAVCKIMWHVERCSLSAASSLKNLATHIKKDEARHVAVSRQYASTLGFDRMKHRDESEYLCSSLVEMLIPAATHFDALGIDPDRLFNHINGFPHR